LSTIKIKHHENSHQDDSHKEDPLKDESFDELEIEQEEDHSKFLREYAKLLDSKFRIPGTNFTFGIDPIIGLVPGLGDLVGYGFSAVLLFSAFKKGISGKILLKMLANIGLDALAGMIPVFGTIFDFIFKANKRNHDLLIEFVEEDKHSGSAWRFIAGFIAITLLVVASVIYGVFSFFSWVWGLF